MDASDRLGLIMHRENTTLFAPAVPPTLPVTLVTGYLGAGKTSLLTHILAHRVGLKVGVVLNDVGRVGVDAAALNEAAPDRLLEFSGGCVCCSSSVSGAVTDAVAGLLTESSLLDYLVIEVSGVTDPCALVNALDARFGRLYRCRLDAVVCVVDADLLCAAMRAECDSGSGSGSGGGSGSLDASVPLGTLFPGAVSTAQLAASDTIILNKADLVPPADLDAATALLTTALPGVKVLRATRCAVPLSAVLDVAQAGDGRPPEGTPSHEAAAVPWNVGDGKVRSAARSARAAAVASPSTPPLGPLRASLAPGDGNSTGVFKPRGPLHLGRVQALFAGLLAAGPLKEAAVACARGMCVGGPVPQLPGPIVRLKGCLGFSHDPDARVFVQLSGRGRMSLQSDKTRRPPAPMELLAVGPCVSDAGLEAALGPCTDSSTPVSGHGVGAGPGDGTSSGPAVGAVAPPPACVLSDPRFEVLVDVGACVGSAPPVLLFRVSAAHDSGYSTTVLGLEHGVDTNQLNTALAQSVCGGGQGLLLLTCDLPGARLRAVRPLESGSSSASVGGYTLEPVEAGSASDLTVLVWGAAEAGAAGEGAPAPDPWALLTAGWPAISAAAAVACKEALRGVPLCKCGW